MEKKEIVRFSHVTKQYPGTLANDDVSLSVQRGEVFALVGENGAGKSTLMNLLYGMQPVTMGEIFIDGEKIGPQHCPEKAMEMCISTSSWCPALPWPKISCWGMNRKRD